MESIETKISTKERKGAPCKKLSRKRSTDNGKTKFFAF